eukprot:1157310-Pelagomonas_calceolata.AAC.2
MEEVPYAFVKGKVRFEGKGSVYRNRLGNNNVCLGWGEISGSLPVCQKTKQASALFEFCIL